MTKFQKNSLGIFENGLYFCNFLKDAYGCIYFYYFFVIQILSFENRYMPIRYVHMVCMRTFEATLHMK